MTLAMQMACKTVIKMLNIQHYTQGAVAKSITLTLTLAYR